MRKIQAKYNGYLKNKRTYFVGRHRLSREVRLHEEGCTEQLIYFKVMKGKWRKEVSGTVTSKQVKRYYWLNCRVPPSPNTYTAVRVPRTSE